MSNPYDIDHLSALVADAHDCAQFHMKRYEKNQDPMELDHAQDYLDIASRKLSKIEDLRKGEKA